MTCNVWLSNDFQQQFYCLKNKNEYLTKVRIPKQFKNFIENDQEYGDRYELVVTGTNNDSEDYLLYWKFHKHHLCHKNIFECIKIRKTKKFALCTHLVMHVMVTLTVSLMLVAGYQVQSSLIFSIYYETYIKTRIVFSYAFITPVFIILTVKFFFKYNIRIIDVYHAMVITNPINILTAFLSINFIQLLVYISYDGYYYLAELCAFATILTCYLISYIYVMCVSTIARYVLPITMILFTLYVVYWNELIVFDGYTNVLNDEVVQIDGFSTVLMILWPLMAFVLFSLIFYVKLHPKSRNKKSLMYQLNNTLLGIFSVWLDYIYRYYFDYILVCI